MRMLARFVLPLTAWILACQLAGCSSEGTTPDCSDAAACLPPPSGGNVVVGQGGNTGEDAAEEPVEQEAGEDAEATD